MSTEDVRTRLSEALDEAEKRARDLLVHAQRNSLAVKEPKLLGRTIPGWHDWPDVEAMCARELRAAERDRQLLAECFEVLDSTEERRGSFDCPEDHSDAAAKGLARLWLDSAAAFWLGTQEADR